MKNRRFIGFCSIILAAITYTILDVAPAWTQKPPPPANPQAPTINPLTPLGIQRGQTAEFNVTGTLLVSPTGASIGDVPGKISIPTEDKNGQDAAKFKMRIEVPA